MGGASIQKGKSYKTEKYEELWTTMIENNLFIVYTASLI